MDKDFDDILARKIRESLNNYPVDYQPGAWEEFSRNYLQKPPLLMSLWRQYAVFRIAAALLTAAFGIGALYYGLRPDRSTNAPKVTHSAAVVPSPQLPESVPPTAELTVSASTTDRRKKKEVTTRALDPSKSIVAMQQADSLCVVATAHPNSADTLATLVAVAPLPLPVADSILLPLPSEIARQSNQEKQRIMQVMPALQTIGGIATGSPEKIAVFYGAGLGADLFLHKKVALHAGLQFVQTSYQTPEKRFFVSSLQRNPLGIQAALDYAEEVHYKRIRLSLIQLPLTIKFFIRDNFFINFGGVSYIAMQGTQVENVAQNTLIGRLHNNNNRTQTAAQQMHPFRSLYISGGVRLPVNHHLTLQLEPHVNLSTGDILPDVNHTALQQVGLNMSLFYSKH